jgi:surfactin synthase thioesterase subunit
MPNGTQYYVSFKLTANGKPHPNAYVRLPLYLGMNNRDQAMSWAIRIKWREDTQSMRSFHLCIGDLMALSPVAESLFPP